jgi:hypothetical protein
MRDTRSINFHSDRLFSENSCIRLSVSFYFSARVLPTEAETALHLLLHAIFTRNPGVSLTDAPISGCRLLTSDVFLSAWSNFVNGK